MDKDPDMTWEGEFPYDVLAPAGVTPRSSMREVRGSIRYFTQRRLVGDAHAAWNTLTVVKDRLFIDFFLYRIAADGEAKEHEHG